MLHLVHGGYEEWSLWTECTTFCGNGTQTRKRTCTAPIPRCGGDPCSAKEKIFEKRDCTGTCHGNSLLDLQGKFDNENSILGI